ncbi:heavy metal-responsive transcriptional regulator [Streptomyces sp. ST2-7A]|uniref:heavy metal-responsive transcriptional regulator n=1 Tax=Streptomyces sp. ST2-7A TaxID=2907214 RepID=UPI001F32D084|nr:heavy metal-responsive transcriptional regulator [Streptomyces sp. ST2-7A]MCE7080611.1 heavy metal-responsive transcriptional regulator [Streptomyces sp. ST2-7A]
MRIGSLAHAAGVTTRTVRFWERAGLLPEPPRTPAGYRDYPRESADRVMFIRRAQAAGLSLAEIREVLWLREGRAAPDGRAERLIAAHLDRVEERIEELNRTRETLRSLIGGTPVAAGGGGLSTPRPTGSTAGEPVAGR